MAGRGHVTAVPAEYQVVDAPHVRVQRLRLGEAVEQAVLLSEEGQRIAARIEAPRSADLQRRLGQIQIGQTRDKQAVVAKELSAAGAMAALLKQSGQTRLIRAHEVAAAIVDLCSDGAADRTGELVILDGRDLE